MHRLVPEFIQKQIVVDNFAGSFDACALFADISGFTPITDAIMGHGQHGAEVLAGIIRDVFDPLVQSVFEQGGFVTNFAGDAFTAVFPKSHGAAGAIDRALAAAWQMQESMTNSARYQTPYGTFTLSVKVGLAEGEVNWGIVSSAAGNRAVYYFQGPAIDGCAQAQGLAGAGEVVVDPGVYKALESRVTGVPIEQNYRIAAVTGVLPAPESINLSPVEQDLVARFFPPEATREESRGELRQVTSMFVSLPTVRTVELLQSFMQIIFRLQDRYGGMLNRLDFGDKGANLLFFWGAPTAYENDVTRALNFILDLQSLTVIPVNAGIAYGIAHTGYSGGALAGEYTCHGRGTTLAARFMQASARGEIWLDENVAARAERNFEVDFEENMAFKGFAERQKVFVLLERKEVAEPFYDGQMVGRQFEQEQLASFVRPIWLGKCPGTMLIWGEPGIGKSRLLYAFLNNLESVTDHEFSVFVCQADEILRESLNPFRYWLRGYFGQSERQSDARNKRGFNRKLDRLIAVTKEETLLSELDRTRSFLGALINLYWPDSLYEQLDAQGRYENSLTGLLTLLQAESMRRPVILLLEDVHWLDEDSKLFLVQLMRGLAQPQHYPIAILATARPGRDNAVLGGDIAYQEMALEQMPAGDQAKLASDQLGSPIGPDLLALLVERAEGNPFFTEQIVRYLQEEALLVQVAGEWQLESGQGFAMPTDVRAVLVARLDRLSQNVRDVVQTASVLGREFEVQLLARMLHGDPGLSEKVAQAVEMSIWSPLNELRYLFKHTLLRDAAYSMQLRTRRQSLHRLAVEAMESLYGDDLGAHYGELAYHAEQARLIDKACRYLEMAGDTAKDVFQNRTAVDYYVRVLALTTDEDLETRYRLLSTTASLRGRLADYQDQARDLDEMMVLAERMADTVKQLKALISRAWMSWWQADYEGALEISRQAAVMAQEAGQPDLVARANHVSTWSMIQRGEYDGARQLAEQALTIARQSGDRHLETNALHSLGFIHRVEGDFYAGRVVAEEALAIERDAGDWRGEGTALGNLGVAHMSLGDYAAARQCFRQAQTISVETGSRVQSGSDLINLSWIAQTQGEWQSAIRYGEEGLSILRRAQQPEMEAEGLIWLGHARVGLGQVEEALAAYDKSLQLRRDLGQEYLAMGVLAGMARAAVMQDDLASALEYVKEIVSFLDGGGSLDGTWEPLRLYLTCYQVLEIAGNPRGRELLETAHQKLQEWASKIPDEKLRHRYLDNVPWHREIVTIVRELSAGR